MVHGLVGNGFVPIVRCKLILHVYHNALAYITRKFLPCLQSIASMKPVTNVSVQMLTSTYVPVVNAVMRTFANT